MFEIPRRGRQARNFRTKSSENSRSEIQPRPQGFSLGTRLSEIVFRTGIFRKLTLHWFWRSKRRTQNPSYSLKKPLLTALRQNTTSKVIQRLFNIAEAVDRHAVSWNQWKCEWVSCAKGAATFYPTMLCKTCLWRRKLVSLEEARDDRNYLTGCELELFFCRKTSLWGVAANFHHEFR